MRCFHCGDPHQARDAAVCAACGHPLPVAELGSVRPEASGKRPANISLPPLAQGERRQVTIWMADLCGYTGLNETFDPEEVAAFMDRIEHEATRVVHEHDGIVNQFVGDEIVALFGVPTAHEDDAQRAVASALELHRFVQKLGRELEAKLSHPLRLHTGIHSGLVLARLQDPRHGLYGLRGDTINVAARLRSLAQPDEILTSETTQQAIAPFFQTEPLEPFALKGRSAPVMAYRVLAATNTATPFEAAQIHGLAPLAGRARELAVLSDCYERARAGEGRLVTVSAHAGVGKSRLLHEFRQRVEPSATVFSTRCEAYGKVTPYQAFLRPLRQALGGIEGRGAEASAATVEATLARLGLSDYALVFASLLALGGDGSASHLAQGEELRELTLRATVELFVALAREKPIVLLMEDWHLADEGSSTAVVHLARSIAEHRILIVVSHRPVEAAPWRALAAQTIDLSPLSPAETSALAASLLGTNIPPRTMARIHEHTGGNALFVEQICRALAESGSPIAETLEAAAGVDRGKLPIPDTVQAVLRARIDSIPAIDAAILRLASVLGTEFSLPHLEFLVSGSPEQGVDLAECMLRLAAADLVYRDEERGPFMYRFKHTITQEVAYETLLRQRRRELHTSAARAIEKASASTLDEHCEALALHYGAGEEYERAAVYAERAGDKAARTFSLEEARQLYRQALLALEKLDANDERWRRRVDVGLKWAAACIFKPAPEQLEVLQASLEHAERIGYKSGLAYTHCWLGCIEYALGDQERAAAWFATSMTLALGLGDDRLVAQVHVNLGQSYAAATDYSKALEHLEEGLERKDRVPSGRAGARAASAMRAGTGRAYALGYLGLVHGDMGQFDLAYKYLEEALSIVRAARSRAVEGSILTQLAMVQLWQGAWEACRATASAMQGTAEQVHGPYILAMSKTVSGYAKFMSGETVEGIELLREAAAWLEKAQVGLTLSWNEACLAEALALSLLYEEAKVHADRALDRARARDRLGEVAAYRALGLAEMGRHGGWDAGQIAFEQAVATAERKRSQRDAAITRFRGATVARHFGDEARASQWLAQAVTAFTAMKMDWYRSEAERLAQE
jgi:class 3 adenylate cyclase/tetratricopeptide (TPR) repeat protein